MPAAFRWNRGLDAKKLRAAYAPARRIAIPGFLDAGAAEELYRSFATLAERNLWYDSDLGDGDTLSYRFQSYPLRNFPVEKFPEARLPERHALWRAAELFDSAKAHRLMTSLSGHRLENRDATCFASRYLPGHYLKPHDDGPAPPRRLAYVLNLTKDWQPGWGGELVVLGGAAAGPVLETYPPSFNTLVVFDVPLFHAVTPVEPAAAVPRYAISGWYHAKKT